MWNWLKFTRVSANRVESSDGFSWESISQFENEYREGDHVAIIPTDFGYKEAMPRWARTVPFGREIWYGTNMYQVVYLSKFQHWEAPYENEPISTEKMDKIRNNIDSALKYMGAPYKIE